MKSGYFLGSLFSNLSCWSKFNLPPVCCLNHLTGVAIYVTKLTWNCISLLRQANGSSRAWNNFDFNRMSFSALIIFVWYYNYNFLNWCNISPAQTFRRTQLELEVEVFFPCNTCLNAWTWCVEVVKSILYWCYIVCFLQKRKNWWKVM